MDDRRLSIPARELPATFERFRRGSAAWGTLAMGMGLAYDKRILAQYGGTPAVQSVLAIDSRFDLRLRLDAGR